MGKMTQWRFYAHYLAWGVPDTKGFNRKQFLQSNDDFRNIKKQTRVSSQQAKQESLQEVKNSGQKTILSVRLPPGKG